MMKKRHVHIQRVGVSSLCGSSSSSLVAHPLCEQSCFHDPPLRRTILFVFAAGIFHDCAVHDIDTVCWVVGDFPTSVYAIAHAHVDMIRSCNDVDTVVISMKFRDGTLATIDLSRFAAYGYDQRVEVWYNVLATALCCGGIREPSKGSSAPSISSRLVDKKNKARTLVRISATCFLSMLYTCGWVASRTYVPPNPLFVNPRGHFGTEEDLRGTGQTTFTCECRYSSYCLLAVDVVVALTLLICPRDHPYLLQSFTPGLNPTSLRNSFHHWLSTPLGLSSSFL